MLTRRGWIRAATAGAAAATQSRFLVSLGWLMVAEAPELTVYRSPGCICCRRWVTQMRTAGFKVSEIDLHSRDAGSIKAQMGIPKSLQSCHTAFTGGYVIEGHVPATSVLELLQQKQKIAGLAVPGMPTGAPGMEGGAPERYEVMAFAKNGKAWVYARR